MELGTVYNIAQRHPVGRDAPVQRDRGGSKIPSRGPCIDRGLSRCSVSLSQERLASYGINLSIERQVHERFRSQLTFDSFTLGKFVSFTAEGCPDGSLQISEAQRPDVGGLWCGTSWGPAIYYSETSSVSITLKLLRLSKDQTGFNFDFRMAYKMIRKSDAVVRYGNPFVGR